MNGKILVVVVIAVIISMVIWGVLTSDRHQQCQKFIEEIKNNPDGLIAQDCKGWGFKINQTDSNLP